jgi:SET domain-containing protein
MNDVTVKPSSIQGLGVFALRPFAPGEMIRRVHIVREITKAAPLHTQLGEQAEYCAYPDGKIMLWGTPDRHLNHSCNPNAFEQYENDAVFIIARCAIVAGVEITVDYNLNTSGGSSWPCHCGTTRCRGETIGDFFHLPLAIQKEYRPLLADWFLQRHKQKIRELDELTAL